MATYLAWLCGPIPGSRLWPALAKIPAQSRALPEKYAQPLAASGVAPYNLRNFNHDGLS